MTATRIDTAADGFGARIGHIVPWLIFVAVVTSAATAVVCYPRSVELAAWVEIQWYLFAAVFQLSVAYAVPDNGGVGTEASDSSRRRARAWLALLATAFALSMSTLLIVWVSWPALASAYQTGARSNSVAEIIVWPARLLVPVGLGLAILQAMSKLLKQVRFLMGQKVLRSGGSEAG